MACPGLGAMGSRWVFSWEDRHHRDRPSLGGLFEETILSGAWLGVGGNPWKMWPGPAACSLLHVAETMP